MERIDEEILSEMKVFIRQYNKAIKLDKEQNN
jgi:hypothetical protein